MSFKVDKKSAAAFPRSLDKEIVIMDTDLNVVNIGYPGLSSSTGGTGAGATVDTATGNQIDNHPGVLELTTGTTTTGRCAIYGGFTVIELPDNGTLTFDSIVKIDTLDDGVDTYQLHVGMHNGTTAAPTYGLYFRYDKSVSDNWQIVAENAGTESSTTTSTAVTTDWLCLKIVYTATNASSGSAEYFINGTSLGTQTTNLPFSAAFNAPNFQILKTAGTNAREFWLDAVLVTMKLNNERIG